MKTNNESYFCDVSERFLIMFGFESPCRLLMCACLNIVFMNATNLFLIVNGNAIDFTNRIRETDEEGKKDDV